MDQIKKIKVNNIIRWENSRAEIGDAVGLMQSIKDQGLISPLIVCPDFLHKDKTKYLLVAGNRRYDALVKLGYKEVSCLINENITSEKDLMILNLSENIQRQNTTLFEEGRYVIKLKEEYGMTDPEIQVRLGVTKKYIAGASLAYNTVPEKFKKLIVYNPSVKNESGKIPVSVALSFDRVYKEKLINKSELSELYELALKNKMSDLKLKQLTRALRSGMNFATALNLDKKMVSIRGDVNVLISEKNDLMKKYGIVTASQLIDKIMFGDIKERFTRTI